MPDKFTPEKRHTIMAHVKGRDTGPEKAVRSLLHRLGYRFRLHQKDLPGNPDIVLPRHHKVIFVHGCFWHGHPGCRRAGRPVTNTAFWNKKLDKNVERDARVQAELQLRGWKVLVVWQCQIRDRDRLAAMLKHFLADERDTTETR